MNFVQEFLIGHVDFRAFYESEGIRFWGKEAFCPFHDDRNPSFSIDLTNSLYNCHACGEGGDAVSFFAKRHNLNIPDAIRELKRRHGINGGPGERGEGGVSIPTNATATVQPPSRGCTLAKYVEAKRLPLDFLKELGVRELTYLDAPAVRIPYRGADGSEIAVRFRVELEKRNPDNRFRWKSGSKPVLYGLDRLDLARKAGFVVLVEGESDCHTLWFHGIPALGIPGASNWREDRDAPHLDGIETIYVVVEPDTGGETVRRWLAKSRIRDRVRLLDLGQFKDASGLYLDDPQRFKERLQATFDAAVPWSKLETEQTETERREAWEKCERLAREQSILDRLVDDLHSLGVVGEDRAAKIIFLSVVSRYLQRPVSVVVKGPSSSGKSFVTEQVLRFFSPSAYYALSAMSEHALAYSDEPLKHRMLVVYEVAGMEGDLTTYLIRSLLSEGRIRYETVEKTSEGLKPRLIEREGPTGLIVTTTALKLHPENETRLLSLTTTDTPEQTAKILAAIAANGDDKQAVDFQRWHALDTWIAGAEHRVSIPYAGLLASETKAVAVRLRRDFRMILSLIEAHAILHQASRGRDASGAILASIEDYRVVRDLVANLISDAIEMTVPVSVRETVEAVEELVPRGSDSAPTTAAKVGQNLGLDKSTASRRVKAALDRGYLRNLEERKGRPYRIVLGDPIPIDIEILPAPEKLRGCTVAGDSEGIKTLSPSLAQAALPSPASAGTWGPL